MNDVPLTPAEIALMLTVFRRHPEVTAVRLFGSRAKGSHTSRSDVDLALWGDVDTLRAQAIAAELDELPLAYRFDVQAYEAIKFAPLRDHIARRGILLYPELTSGSEQTEAGEAESCLEDLTSGRRDFWVLACVMSRKDLLALIDRGLREAGGSSKRLAEMFRIRAQDYRRFMDYLRRRGCIVDHGKAVPQN